MSAEEGWEGTDGDDESADVFVCGDANAAANVGVIVNADEAEEHVAQDETRACVYVDEAG